MSFFDGIDFVVSDAAKAVSTAGAVGSAAQAVGAGAAAGAAAAGGVTMDRDEMTSFLTQVKQTRELCQQQVAGNSFRPDGITPPATDQASATFTNAAQTSREARNKYLEEQLKMYNELVDKLEKALGLTTESDNQAAGTVNQAAGGGKYS